VRVLVLVLVMLLVRVLVRNLVCPYECCYECSVEGPYIGSCNGTYILILLPSSRPSHLETIP